MGKIKVGVLGARRGQTMISVLIVHPDAEIVAVCDKSHHFLNEVRELAIEKNMKISLYDDFEDFFKHDMDAVVLANYANEHAPYAIRFLESGRHVLSEVLPCETMAQAVELIEAVESSGKIYAYAENYCYMRGPFEMWQRYENGDIGEIQYAEGEYIHDCAHKWHQITYGERNHWRNRAYSTFYCTHSVGPILTTTGLRPVQVVGFETKMNVTPELNAPLVGCSAIEMITLENGAILKSVHGSLKREPGSFNYEIYGTKGMMETDRWKETLMSIYIEGEKVGQGDLKHYEPKAPISPEMAVKFGSHGGSEYYPTHFFIEKILGNPDGKKYSIDVYTAVNIGICGILAYRSILNGNTSVDIPDMRNKEDRDRYRNDHACTNPAIARDQLLPVSPNFDFDSLPNEVFEQTRRRWQNEVDAKKDK